MSAQEWEDYAASAERMHAWDIKVGLLPTDAVCHKARSARDAAKSLRLEIETGVPH